MDLGTEVKRISVDPADKTPRIIWMLENPKSPIALPGKISLYDHCCLHILLDQDLSSAGKAFVTGFCMGSDTSTKSIHLKILKFASRYLYPKTYKLTSLDLLDFQAGFKFGQSLSYKEVNEIDFKRIASIDVKFIRKTLGIDPEELDLIRKKVSYLRANQNSRRKKSAQKMMIPIIFCAFIGGFLLALNLEISGYGFIFLACSSGQLLIKSLIEKDRIMIYYATTLFVSVDSLGVYRWVLT